MKTEKIRKMIFRSSVVIVALMGLFFFQREVNTNPTVNDKETLILQGLIQTLEYVHYEPKALDDNFSKAVYKSFLNRLDSQKRFFTQKDIDALKVYETAVDNQVQAGNFDFFNAALPMLDAGIKRSEAYFNEVITQPFDFSKGDLMEMDSDKRAFAKDPKAQKEQWKTNITFEVMTKWVDKVNAQKERLDNAAKKIVSTDKEDDKKAEIKTDEQLQEDAIKDVKKVFTDWFSRLSKLKRADRMETYLASIANYYDPHTDYFSPKEKADFDINMGGKLEGIGARLQIEGDYTKITSVVVGGPAWKTKKIDDNDIIMKVAQKGQEPVDIAGMRVDDVVQLIRGKKGTIVILTVKKKDNTITDVIIERDEVQLDETKAKSVIIDIPGQIQNIGYINLPKFYSTFEDGGNSCATDIHSEIEKLKTQNVNGIILDLRNNSGGSLNDVVDMSGFFIEDGPIVQVKGREGKPFLHVDKDKSVLYDGPLIIMVNHFSASASEIIAAAMQDYDRAIIVGSTSTFGKGTVQRFYDLDRSIRGYDEFKPLGNVKMTVQKFYRVNGGSTQLKGVVPDIILPDTYQYVETGEKEYDNPLEWTEIDPINYKQNVVRLDNKAQIIQNSTKRIADNPDFNSILLGAKMIKENRDQTKWPSKINDYRAMVDKRNEESKKFDDLFKNDISGVSVRNLKADESKMKVDESYKARTDELIKDLKKDIYIGETMNIMRDMITLEKSFVLQQKKIDNQ